MPTNLPQRKSKPLTRMLFAVFAMVFGLGLIFFAAYRGGDASSRDTIVIDN